MGENFSYAEFFASPSENPVKKKMKGTICQLRDAWGIYCRRFATSIGIMAIPSGFSIFSSALLYFLHHSTLKYSFFYSLLLFILEAGYLVLSLCSVPALLFSFKENIGIKEGYKKGWKILPSYIWVSFLYFAIVIGGFILIFFPGLIFSIWFIFAIFALIYENKKGFQALERSRRLVGGYFWSTFWRLIFIDILLSLIFAPFIFVIPNKIDNIILANLSRDIIGSVLQLLLSPLFFAFLLTLYENLKELKKEEPEIAVMRKALYFLPGILGTLSLCFGLSVVLFAIFWGRDIPPIDDSDLRLSRVEISKEENAYYDLMEAIKKEFLPRNQGPAAPSVLNPSLSGWEGLFSDMLAGKRLVTREADELMAKNEEMFRYFEKALQRPYLQLPQCADPEKLTPSVLFPELSKYRELARWGVVKARYLIAHGKEKEGFEWLLKVFKFGDMVKKSPRPVFIQHLVGEALQVIALKPMREIVRDTNLPSSSLREYAQTILSLKSDEEALKNAFKMEYMLGLNCLKEIERSLFRKSSYEKLSEEWNGEVEFPSPPLSPLFYGIYFKPNKSQLMLADIYRKCIRKVGKFYKDIELSPTKVQGEPTSEESPRESIGESVWLIWLKENVFVDNKVGKRVLSEFDLFDNTLGRKCLRNFEIEATACLFALRAYQKDKGHLPATLQELVPAYLPQVPLDPFDGNPLRYSRDKRIIYCVGQDLKDEGGSVGEEGYWGNWKDPSISVNF